MIIAIISIIFYYPGIVQDDTEFLYQNFTSGSYLDWQPPIYTIWWHIFQIKSAAFVMNLVIYYTGLLYISYILYKNNKNWQNDILVIFSLYPLYATQLVIVLKDVPYTGFLVTSLACLIALNSCHNRIMQTILWMSYITSLLFAVGFKYNGFFAIYPILVLGIYQWLQNNKNIKLNSYHPITRFAISLAAALLCNMIIMITNNVITYHVFDAKESHSSLMVMYNDIANIECSSGEEIIPDNLFAAPNRREIMCNSFFINYRNYEPLVIENWSGANNPTIFTYDINSTTESEFKNVKQIWIKAILNHPLEYLQYRAQFSYNILFSQWWWTPLAGDNANIVQTTLASIAVSERKELATFNGLFIIIGSLTSLLICLYKRNRLSITIIVSSILQLISLYLVLGVPAARFFLWNYLAIILSLSTLGLEEFYKQIKPIIKSKNKPINRKGQS
jgi:hypothetical protein